MGRGALIGVVGGVGPYAGLDLIRKIFDQTIAEKDSDHLPALLLSEPSEIPDRTDFLLGRIKENPAKAIVERLRRLEEAGAKVAGIPCNTSHSAPIMDEILAGMARLGLKIKLIDMIEEVARHIKERESTHGLRPGALTTLGAFHSGVYEKALAKAGLQPETPSQQLMESVHAAIYDRKFGIKAKSNPVTAQARDMILSAIWELKTQGASSIVLGCTELPLAVPEMDVYGMPTVDSSLVLARALIREVAPEKLRPLP